MRVRLTVLSTFVALLAAVPAHATMNFNINYTLAVQGNANFANIQTAVNFVANEYTSLFNDPITINITIDQGNSGLGGSTTSLLGVFTYSQVVTALTADASSADDASFNAALPGSNPTSNDRWFMSTAEAKSLGLLAGNDAGVDGIYTFNSTDTYTYDPANRQVSGAFDFIGVTEHEFSEIMGRIPGLGFNQGGVTFLPFDLGRFTGAGVRNFVDANGVYFSVDGGTTNLHGFNFANGSGSDPQDWDASVATDPFNAFTSANQGHSISSEDVKVLDTLGFNLTPVPEPGTFAMLGTCLIGLGFAAYRRRNEARP